MKYLLAYSALFAAVLASPIGNAGQGDDDKGDQKTCKSDQTVVCSGNGTGGLLSLGNVLAGLLGQSCTGGDVYCCDSAKVEQDGLLNLNLDLHCSLNHLL